MSKKIDIKDFAKRVELLCDFLIDKVKKDGSPDIVTLQNLKDEAADIYMLDSSYAVSTAIEGLSDYMKGATNYEVARGDQQTDRP